MKKKKGLVTRYEALILRGRCCVKQGMYPTLRVVCVSVPIVQCLYTLSLFICFSRAGLTWSRAYLLCTDHTDVM